MRSRKIPIYIFLVLIYLIITFILKGMKEYILLPMYTTFTGLIYNITVSDAIESCRKEKWRKENILVLFNVVICILLSIYFCYLHNFLLASVTVILTSVLYFNILLKNIRMKQPLSNSKEQGSQNIMSCYSAFYLKSLGSWPSILHKTGSSADEV